MLLAEVFGYHRQYVYDIAALCEIVHNGTLIIDDIEDNSTVRRNKECVHLLYGVDISVNAGNLVYFAPMMRLFRSGKYKSEQLNHMATIYL
jgi:geranylgeranyl pyrophosphate synthase